MANFGDGKTIKARKPHKCEWCGETIRAGDQCYRYRGMFDGDWQNWHMHLECEEIYAMNYDYYGFMPFENERPTVEAK